MSDQKISKVTQGIDELEAYLNGHTDGSLTVIQKIPTPPDYSADDIKKLRDKLGVTQRVFAQIISSSPRTVEAWETGINHPTGPTRRLMQLFETNPELVKRLI